MTVEHGRPSAPPGTPDIGDHGLVGDMRTCALVDRWGRMNWLCWPRFDSPPLLRAVIDPDGSSWDITPTTPFRTTRRYEPDTNVLETTFHSDTGTAVVTDFMTVPDEAPTEPQIVRIAEGRGGRTPLRMTFSATRGFDPRRHDLHGGPHAVTVGDPSRPTAWLMCTAPVAIRGGRANLDLELRPGQRFVSMLTASECVADVAAQAATARDATVRWWRRWLGQCRLPPLQREAAARSALVLKLLQHLPSSSLVAAPTTSLPESIGGQRNWDYRYTWLRDASMTLLALQRLGLHQEAMGFWRWLANTAKRHGDDLAVAYTLDGDPVPAERTADLPGHRHSRPVRVGNAAAGQRQHDVYGHVMAAASHCYHHMDMDLAAPQLVLQRIADLAAARWSRPDDAIWELRNRRTRHTYSQLMCWVALDRAVDLFDHGALDGEVATWRTERERLRRALLRGAWNAELGAFTGVVGGTDLDAAALTFPLTGFMPADDPRCRSTRRVIGERLGDHGLLRRYIHDDGLDDREGAFLLATLWLADNHTLDGDPDRGHEVLDRVLSTGNDLGLLAEEAEPRTGAPLGNFPQALTHLGVMDSVERLTAALGGAPD